jgi:hypothetical protein
MQGNGTKSNLQTNIVRILKEQTCPPLQDASVNVISLPSLEIVGYWRSEAVASYVDPLTCLGPSFCIKVNCRIYSVRLFDERTISCSKYLN